MPGKSWWAYELVQMSRRSTTRNLSLARLDFCGGILTIWLTLRWTMKIRGSANRRQIAAINPMDPHSVRTGHAAKKQPRTTKGVHFDVAVEVKVYDGSKPIGGNTILPRTPIVKREKSRVRLNTTGTKNIRSALRDFVQTRRAKSILRRLKVGSRAIPPSSQIYFAQLGSSIKEALKTQVDTTFSVTTSSPSPSPPSLPCHRIPRGNSLDLPRDDSGDFEYNSSSDSTSFCPLPLIPPRSSSLRHPAWSLERELERTADSRTSPIRNVLQHFFYAHGDTLHSLDSSKRVLDELLTDFITELCFEAHRSAQLSGRQKIKLDDIKFACRKNPTYLGKIEEIFGKKDEIDRARKTIDVNDDKVSKSNLKALEAEEPLGIADDDIDVDSRTVGDKSGTGSGR
ncbi:hypothetical protein B7494_g263 [Chlorociboria aeruginascens]|nr:hypothetical protein B7494_g263 [Chlorociboria aeruginascens]